MRKTAKPKAAPVKPKTDPNYESVINAFAKDRFVSHSDGKGFGSGALKVKGKIFAMLSSKSEFVVKLPKERVDELVNKGEGKQFDPGHGKKMKEWVVIPNGKTNWVELAKEACKFVKQGKP